MSFFKCFVWFDIVAIIGPLIALEFMVKIVLWCLTGQSARACFFVSLQLFLLFVSIVCLTRDVCALLSDSNAFKIFNCVQFYLWFNSIHLWFNSFWIFSELLVWVNYFLWILLVIWIVLNIDKCCDTAQHCANFQNYAFSLSNVNLTAFWLHFASWKSVEGSFPECSYLASEHSCFAVFCFGYSLVLKECEI